MRAAGVIVALALALTLQTTLGPFVRGPISIDLVLVAVVYVALTSGPVTGLLAGTLAGVIQDALAAQVIGIGGLAKSLVGFVTGIIGTQFIVSQPLPRFVVFFVASIAHQAIVIGLGVLLDLRTFGRPYTPALVQSAANALIGVLTMQLVELLPGAVERRKMARTRLRR